MASVGGLVTILVKAAVAGLALAVMEIVQAIVIELVLVVVKDLVMEVAQVLLICNSSMQIKHSLNIYG